MPKVTRKDVKKSGSQTKTAPKNLSRKAERARVQSIPKRVNILFLVIFVLFMVLIARLYNMQVVNHKFYANKMSGDVSNAEIIQGSPRGNIYDVTGKPLATTTAVEAVEFTRGQNVTAAQMRKVADRLSTMISPSSSTTTLTTRDKKDYYLADAKNLAKINSEIPAKDKKDSNGNDLSGSAIYQVQLAKVPDSALNFNAQQTFAAELFKQMNGTTTFNTTMIAVGNITAAQQAAIAENEGQLSGISVGTSWNRAYANTTLSGLIGSVSSAKAGLPAEDAKKYLAEGYQRNDRVGTSYLEKGYEKYLQGTHQISKVEVNSKGKVTGTKVVQEGKKGDALKLTLNLDFQQGVDKILKEQLDSAVTTAYGRYISGAYAVVMNPKTGAIYAMSGLHRDPSTGAISNDALSTLTGAFTPGSTVKPGTLTAGWASKAISGNQVFNDQEIKVQGSNPITSDWGSSYAMPLNAVQALQYSSNTYMVQVALAMLGQSYYPNMSVATKHASEVWKELRATYASYGLGDINLGFDIPHSSKTPGYYLGSTKDAGQILFEAFGQYDEYSPLRMAVYASTLANGGKRVAPHIVDGIYQSNDSGDMGDLVKKIEAKTMGNVNISSDNMSILKEGLYEVVNGEGGYTTGTNAKAGLTQTISGKTGTAETFETVNGQTVTTTVSNMVSYAPSDNPNIAVAVMVPNTNSVNGKVAQTGIYITNAIYKLYFGNAAYQTGE